MDKFLGNYNESIGNSFSRGKYFSDINTQVEMTSYAPRVFKYIRMFDGLDDVKLM